MESIEQNINRLIHGDQKSLSVLKDYGVFKTYNKGGRIYPDKEEYFGFFYIVSGRVRLFTSSFDAKEITIFNIKSQEACIFSAGCVLGYVEFDIALEFMEDSKLFLLPNQAFKDLCQSNENILHFNLSLVSKRFKQALEVINDITFKSLKERVIKFLLLNAQHGVVQISQENIANNIGSAREAVARIIKELREDGAISTSRAQILLQPKIFEYIL
ncbi:Crp/Fnr family transcriptional regulator [Helicobacter monodelphidis]|uniref:Crp/Fnr family transcriptional regulator n=1 Tax=Helicobacter sp. 15-1451 TaxID=2004995 RepID=UPI000DCD1B45|nr:Crp/Fnr family transcriptional regulator [Helicobacter sp. 15-1451]RAX57097.1 Crp/Fnr family transcriptional regulator [Helicobacter sp. 15-1451]